MYAQCLNRQLFANLFTTKTWALRDYNITEIFDVFQIYVFFFSFVPLIIVFIRVIPFGFSLTLTLKTKQLMYTHRKIYHTIQLTTNSTSSRLRHTVVISDTFDHGLCNATSIFLLYCIVSLLLSTLISIQTCQAAPQK